VATISGVRMGALLGLIAALGLLLVIWFRVRSARRVGQRPRQVRDSRLDLGQLASGELSGPQAVDRIEDPRLAAAGIIVAIATMDGPISQAEIARLARGAEETFDVNQREALELVSLGRWLAREFGSNTDAVRQLSRIVLRTAGLEAGPDLVRLAEEVALAGDAELAPEQRAVLAKLRHAFGIEPAGRL